MSTEPVPTTSSVIANAFRLAAKGPFRTLIVLAVLISWTSLTFDARTNGIEIVLALLVLAASVYVQIAVIMAAGDPAPATAADPWIRAAIRRRCLWRYVGTSLVVVLGLLVGVALLVVGLYFVGALLGLAQSACVLERRLPMDAITRSARVGHVARAQVGTVFALFVVLPELIVQGGDFLGWPDAIGYAWPGVLAAATIWTTVGTIALTRLFVTLRGDDVPQPDAVNP